MRKGVNSIYTYWPFLLFVLVSFLMLILLPTPTSGTHAKDVLPDAKKLAISTVIEVNKFIISIAYIILGFFGSVLVGKFFTNRRKYVDVFLFVSCILALISIFLGYYLYDTLIVLLNNNIADVEDSSIQWIRKWQFLFIVAAAISFLVFIYDNSFKNIKTNETDYEKEMD